ncbi:MAG: ATP-binding cassette domain-containing protein, partial [Gammaproteobacteria bacterium]|nr:ATP-binding cassette domain-containing protein [Gammaproteobacteria bacterium]
AALADLRLHHIGFVFQAYNLIPVLSAQENVEFVMQVQGVGAAERKERSFKILQEVGLEGMENRRPAQLSGGQQQRVAVARAIVSQPKLVLADEPTANLDSRSMEKLMAHFRELNHVHKVTFLIATHDARVMEWADRRISMEDGRVIKDELHQAV